MESNSEYDDWTNYETWLVDSWIENNSFDQEYWENQAKEFWAGAKADKTFSRKENAALQLGEYMKDYFEDAAAKTMLNSDDPRFCDLIYASLRRVSWHEIAEALINGRTDEEAA